MPYPAPGTQVPIPSSTQVRPSPTPIQIIPIPGDSSFDQAAIAHIAQNIGADPGSLSLVATSTIVIPMTSKRLWDGVIVDTNGKGKIIYQVLIDEGQRVILSGTGIDPQEYWDEAESLFREAKLDLILSQVSQQYEIPNENLSIEKGVFHSFSFTGTIVWQGKIETEDGKIFDYAVDLDGKPVDISAIEVKELEARSQKYGKLSEDLFYLLQAIPDEKLVDVALWMTGVDPKQISEKLKADFPEVGAQHFADGIPVDSEGKPVKLEKEKSKKIQEKYRYYLNEGIGEQKIPIIQYLRELGYGPIDVIGMPMIEVKLSKRDIIFVNRLPWDNLTSIFNNLVDPQSDATMEVVNGTIHTSAVWNLGYPGSFIHIGVADSGVITTNPMHPALNGKIEEAKENLSNDTHAGYVTGVIVGDDDNRPYKGVAYDNNWIYSTKIDTLVEDLGWLADRTSLVNGSISFDASRNMLTSDRVFDYFSRSRNILFVIAAGNDSGEGFNVRSPAKSYNSISVGAFDSQDDTSWNDTMAGFSCWIDPYIDGQTNSGDREKPEVAAVGVGVEVPNIDTGLYDFQSGTSLAAPQVTGLANLLMNRDWDLQNFPPTVKAIIMASAINNIEGDKRLSEQDGAGGIDVATAFSIFDAGGYMNIVWPDINQIFPDSGSTINFYSWNMTNGSLYARSGQRIRAVISWESNPNAQHTFDPLSTDLDLIVFGPSGVFVASSLSFDNNYEIVDFIAPETGNYRIQVRAWKRSQESANLGFGLAWISINNIHLPLIIR